jgi:hypothetical protein
MSVGMHRDWVGLTTFAQIKIRTVRMHALEEKHQNLIYSRKLSAHLKPNTMDWIIAGYYEDQGKTN